MNKFEKRLGLAISQGIRTDVDGYIFPSSISETIRSISTLHDNEMIAFAEWVINHPSDHLPAQLLTIFREENK